MTMPLFDAMPDAHPSILKTSRLFAIATDIAVRPDARLSRQALTALMQRHFEGSDTDYREVFETILFYAALTAQGNGAVRCWPAR